jgi:HlyD family secretion protein
MKSKNKTRYLLSGAAAFLIATSAVGGYAWQQSAKAPVAAAGMEVRRGSLIETASASGKIEPEVQVEV